jgi:hypothetical protein
MAALARTSRVAGRVVGATAVGRVVKRYPIVGVALFVWRWWRRREARIERRVITLKSGETLTVSDRTPANRGI